MSIISAFPTAGGIQVNRQTGPETIECTMVFEGDPGWDDAVAAAAHFGNTVEPQPIETPEEMLEARRASASLTRGDFLLRCKNIGILSAEDAMLAAHGQIPPAVAALLSTWPEEDRFEMELRWAALTVIDRMHPLVLGLAELMGLTAEGLDMIFGIHIEEPQP